MTFSVQSGVLMANTLRERLLRDFGYDLPIAGGDGSSREDPIRILSADIKTVALTEMRILDCLSQVFGIYWRTLSRSLLGPDAPGIEQYKYATVKLTDAEVITERKNHYFDVAALPAADWQPITAPVEAGGRWFPFELGWLHARILDTDRLPPVAIMPYRAPGIEGMLHIYRHGDADAPADVQHPSVQRHFNDAADMVFRTTKDVEAWPDPPPDPRRLMRSYMVGQDAEQAMLVALTTARGHYVKMRVRWMRDRFIDSAAMDWVESALMFVGRGAKPQ
jgi:hypothetical protein